MLNRSGIYVIENSVNGKLYVGSAASFQRRWHEHQSYLRRGVHHAKHLQYAYHKYGAESFIFRPIIVCSKHDLIFYEQLAIDKFNPMYNTAKIAGSSLGVKHTKETCARMSASRRGVKQSPEAIARRTASFRGKVRSDETKKKMSEAAKNRRLTDEQKAHLSNINKGKITSAETRAKQSAALKGIKRQPLTDEHKAKIAAANKGLGAGNKKSEETKERMRKAARIRVQKQREEKL